MTTNRAQQQSIRTSGERLIGLILSDPEMVELISSQAIAAKVAAGDLVPGDQLRLGQFELVPVGTVACLEAAIDAALAALDAASPDEAMRVLEATIPDSAAAGQPGEPSPPEDVATEDVATEEVATEEAPRRRPTAGTEGNDEPAAAATGRPPGMPLANYNYDCVSCEAIVDGTRAQLAWTRFRVILCSNCMSTWNTTSPTP